MIPFIDLHEDIIALFESVDLNNLDKIKFDSEDNDFQVNLPFIKKSNTKLIFSSSFSFFNSYNITGLSHFERILYTIYLNNSIFSRYDNFSSIYSKFDLENIFKSDKTGIINHVEGLYGVNEKWQIDVLYELGIRSIGLVWNYDSLLSTCCKTNDNHGLTAKGKEIIQYIASKNIILDLAHISDKSFSDICSIYKKPLLVSHIAIRSLNDCDRNITDEQITMIKDIDGLIGINFSTLFLNGSFSGEIKDVINHMKYIIDRIGIKYVAIGTDFEGIGKDISPTNLKSLNDIPNLENELLTSGFTKDEVEMIFYKNAYNFISKVI